MDPTAHFGFTKKLPGDLIMGKDINDTLDEIDAQMFERERMILPVTAKLINPASVPVGGLAGLAPPDYQIMSFTSKVTLYKARLVIFAPFNLLGVPCFWALALGSAPATPITVPQAVAPAAGLDYTEVLATPVVIPTTDRLVLVASAAGPGLGPVDISFTVEVDITE